MKVARPLNGLPLSPKPAVHGEVRVFCTLVGRTVFQPVLTRGLIWILLGLCLLFGLPCSLRAELESYVANDKNNAQNEPPAGGGNGWLPVGVGAQGVTVNAGETIWLACRNVYNRSNTKTWDVELTSTGLPGDLSYDNLPSPEQVGFDASGAKIGGQGGFSFNNKTGVRGFHLWFKPQPAWERIALVNKTQLAITFTVKTSSSCGQSIVSANKLLVQTCYFGAVGPGIMLTNQYITKVLMFPQNIPIDPIVLPTFSAPTNSGNWTGSVVYVDPLGSNAPLGGVQFVSDGLGLDPSQSCGFSFAMQGPAADLQYTMYAYDSVLQEFQDYDLDLRPILDINAPANNNNLLGLQFLSVPGLNYTLQLSPDLFNWNPIQTFSGTGGTNFDLEPIIGPFGFFRLSCAPSTPPVLSAINAVTFSNSLTLVFNQALDSSSATNPFNFQIGNINGTIVIQSLSQIRPDTVVLGLGSVQLLPGVNYFLGVMGVSNLAGQVMAPMTLPFTAATLQTPCPGGELIARQAYSECNLDGFWHVVEDDYYLCPPSGSPQAFRVADDKTTQPCGSPQATPSPVGLLYPTSGDVATTCQSPVLIGKVIIVECVGGLWSDSTYLEYQCLDGTKWLSGPVQNVPANPPTPCSQPPPPPPGG
jgi:hypothetical protein